MRDVRLWIKKEGRAKYISHLDMNRCFTRAVRRAGINMWYTEGFNPHPYLNFLTPLSLGVESDGEPLDIRILDDTDLSAISERMNKVLPEGVSVVRVTENGGKCNEIAFAEYELLLDFEDGERAENFTSEASLLVERGELYAEKTAKKGRNKTVKQVDICAHIKACSLETVGEQTKINVTVSAGSDNLNPSLLINALCEKLYTPEFIAIRRKSFFKQDMTRFE